MAVFFQSISRFRYNGSMKILVVDDEKDIRDFLKSTLESEMFAVDVAKDGQEGSYFARTNEYDAIILDNVLPKKMGCDVCREIRESGSQTPILMLSVKSEIDEKTLHLESGADDYLTKPYSHKELMARIRALLRRGRKVESTIFKAENITLDSTRGDVTVNNKSIYLTRKEFCLLELLLKNQGKIVSCGTIMEHVWDMEGNPLSKTIETHMVNLRRKIEKGKKKIIHNIPGRGYKIYE